MYMCNYAISMYYQYTSISVDLMDTTVYLVNFSPLDTYLI